MAALTLNLTDETLDHLKAEAAKAGMAVEDWAARRLGMAKEASPFVRGYSDATEALKRLAEYDRTGDFVDGEEALNAFVAEVEARAAARG